MIRRVLVVLSICGMIGVGLLLLEFVVLRGKTPSITDGRGRPVAGSVASLEALELGGAKQWILIRVVVHWDRRGAGKSYGARTPSSALTVRQNLEDTYELTQLLRERFEQDRIFLLGHSWGSYLGLLAAMERPDYYHAFIGVGQVAAGQDRVKEVQRRFVTERAHIAGDPDLAHQFDAGLRQVTEDDLFRFGGQLRGARSFWPLLRTGLQAREYTLIDAWNVKRGSDLLLREMSYDVIEGPLDAHVLEVQVPVFFMLGRHDLATPSTLAALYLDALAAPYKDVIWFENSAHFPFFEESERFSTELARIARLIYELDGEFTSGRDQLPELRPEPSRNH
jgi:pimeloyl-ACP methyl ester carboxylesterase